MDYKLEVGDRIVYCYNGRYEDKVPTVDIKVGNISEVFDNYVKTEGGDIVDLFLISKYVNRNTNKIEDYQGYDIVKTDEKYNIRPIITSTLND